MKRWIGVSAQHKSQCTLLGVEERRTSWAGEVRHGLKARNLSWSNKHLDREWPPEEDAEDHDLVRILREIGNARVGWHSRRNRNVVAASRSKEEWVLAEVRADRAHVLERTR